MFLCRQKPASAATTHNRLISTVTVSYMISSKTLNITEVSPCLFSIFTQPILQNTNNTRWLYCVECPTIQCLAGRGLLSVHKLFTSYIRRCQVPRACDWVTPALSAMLLIFSFQFSLVFFHVGQPGSTAAYLFTQYRTLDVGKNVDRYGFLYGAYSPREWFWIDSNGKDGN